LFQLKTPILSHNIYRFAAKYKRNFPFLNRFFEFPAPAFASSRAALEDGRNGLICNGTSAFPFRSERMRLSGSSGTFGKFFLIFFRDKSLYSFKTFSILLRFHNQEIM